MHPKRRREDVFKKQRERDKQKAEQEDQENSRAIRAVILREFQSAIGTSWQDVEI